MAAYQGRGDAAHGFHAGELAVQRVAGVEQEAARLEGMLAPAEISAGIAGFLAERTFAAITARDRAGRLWTSPLVAAPGFLRAVDPSTLRVRATPAADDPLHALPPHQAIGLIAIDYLRRRRFRLNGTLVAATENRLEVRVAEAFGNCPQFLPQRSVEAEPLDHGSRVVPAEVVIASGPLSEADQATLTSSTSFVLGTTHPQRGNDTSHRGGAAGFVRTDGDTVWWPDYPGNNLFNSLGNLQVDPEAALLFPDFDRHTALHLHGTAELVVRAPEEDEGGTGRRIVFSPKHRVHTRLSAASDLISAYPMNPMITTTRRTTT